MGKSCVMHRFIKDEFASSTRATIGMDFCTRQLGVDVLQVCPSAMGHGWKLVGGEAGGAFEVVPVCQPPPFLLFARHPRLR